MNPLAHWRDTARPAKFFIIDANIIWPIVIFVVAMSTRTLILLVLSAIFLLAIERVHFTIRKVVRYMFVFIVGPIRYRKGWWE